MLSVCEIRAALEFAGIKNLFDYYRSYSVFNERYGVAAAVFATRFRDLPERDRVLVERLVSADIGIQELPAYSFGKLFAPLIGELGDWEFMISDCFCHWIASATNGLGIIRDRAEEFNAKWRHEVRVVGFAGGASVDEWLSSGRTIDRYHIDTQDGLNAFAGLIRSLH